MLRQKRYHDRNAIEKQFEIDDRVLVFIPRRKIGKSPKLMNFWYGPCVIVLKKYKFNIQGT
jgi:hypothetical protein